MPRPTVRVLALLELLQSGGLRTVGELAAALDVDERTVRRYALHLLELGVPVESVRGRHGGYRVGAGYRLPPLMLTDDEAVAVALALASAPGAAADTASAKIRRVLPVPLAGRLAALLAEASGPGPGRADARTLLIVAEAAHDHRPVVIGYVDRQGRRTERTMLPWGVVAHEGRWYVTGPDSASGEHRTFRVDRIEHVRLGTGRAVAPAGFDARAQVLAGLAATPWRWEVVLRVRASPAFIATQLPPGVATADPLGDAGWTLVRLRAERLDWVALAIAALDVPFVVERPDELRGELTALAGRLAARAARQRDSGEAPAADPSERAD